MTVKIPGYSTVSGRPQAILKLLKDARIFDDLDGEYIDEQQAEAMLREMNKKHRIIIEEE